MKSQLSQALEPYRVLDLTQAIGWTCGKLLADLGADVIKIEPPGGDTERRLGPFYHDDPHPERSLSWFAAHTNQRGITLNMESVDGQALWLALVCDADFVVESCPPGFLDRHGVGFRALSQRHPQLIWTSITPFGHSGPYAHYRASDVVGMALGGLMYLCGDADRPPVRLRPAQAYLQAGLQAAVATLLAHHHRVRSGEGQFIDVSMQQAVSWTIIPTRQYWEFEGLISERGGPARAFGDQVRRIIFPCQDGHVAVMGVMNSREWGPMVDWLASEAMAEDLTEASWAILAQYAGPSPLTQAALTDAELAHVIALSQRYALAAQDVVGGGGMEIEVGKGERQQEALGREGDLPVPDVKRDVSAGKGVHLLTLQTAQGIAGIGQALLQGRIVEGFCLVRRREHALHDSFDRTERMVRYRYDLKSQRQHVGGEPRLDQLTRIDVVARAELKALIKNSRNRGNDLQIVRDAHVVE